MFTYRFAAVNGGRISESRRITTRSGGEGTPALDEDVDLLQFPLMLVWHVMGGSSWPSTFAQN
jgi:hypothetical protein